MRDVIYGADSASFLGIVAGLLALVFFATGCGPSALSTPGIAISTRVPLSTPENTSATPDSSTVQVTSVPVKDTPVVPATPLTDRNPTATSADTPPSTGTADATKPSDPTATLATDTPEGETDLQRVSRSRYSFKLPEGWTISELALIATAFAADGECSGASIIDREAPSGSGQAPFLFQSSFQVCARDTQGQSLDDFIQSVYGQLRLEFVAVEVGGLNGYRIDQESSVLIFVQSDTHRFQLATSVAAEPDLEALRVDQVRRLIESVLFN